MDNSPLPFLLGYPFFINKGAIFDLDSDIPSVSLRKTDSQPKLQLISTADKASLFIFPFPNDFFAAINSAFINEATELPDFEQLFQEFYIIFLQGSTCPFDDSLTENNNEPFDLDSSSLSGSLQHNTNHAQLFGNDANYSDTGSGVNLPSSLVTSPKPIDVTVKPPVILRY